MESSNELELAKARKKDISKLLQDFPLYTSIELPEFYPTDSQFLKGHTFNFFCKEENSVQTFSLSVLDENITAFAMTARSSAHSGAYIPGQLLNFSDYCVGLCSSCRKYQIDFLINCFTKKPKVLSNAA